MEQRTETRRRFIEGKGWHVEEVPIGTPAEPGQSVVKATLEPAQRVSLEQITAEMVPLSVAQEVVKAAGLLIVPASFLTEEQLAELEKAPETGNELKRIGPAFDPFISDDISKLNVEQASNRVKLAASFEELNALMANEKRKGVLAAAEERAAELKKGN